MGFSRLLSAILVSSAASATPMPKEVNGPKEEEDGEGNGKGSRARVAEGGVGSFGYRIAPIKGQSSWFGPSPTLISGIICDVSIRTTAGAREGVGVQRFGCARHRKNPAS